MTKKEIADIVANVKEIPSGRFDGEDVGRLYVEKIWNEFILKELNVNTTRN